MRTPKIATYTNHRAHEHIEELKKYDLVQINKDPDTLARLHGHTKRFYMLMPQMVFAPDAVGYEWDMAHNISAAAWEQGFVLQTTDGNPVGTWGHYWLDFTRGEVVDFVLQEMVSFMDNPSEEGRIWEPWGTDEDRSYDGVIFEVIAETPYPGWFGVQAQRLSLPWEEFVARWQTETRVFMNGFRELFPDISLIGGGDGAMPTAAYFDGWKMEDAFARNMPDWTFAEEIHGVEGRNRGLVLSRGHGHQYTLVDDWHARVPNGGWDDTRLTHILGATMLSDFYYMSNDFGSDGPPRWHPFFDQQYGSIGGGIVIQGTNQWSRTFFEPDIGGPVGHVLVNDQQSVLNPYDPEPLTPEERLRAIFEAAARDLPGGELRMMGVFEMMMRYLDPEDLEAIVGLLDQVGEGE